MGLLIMFHLLLVYPNIVAIFLPYQEGSAAHYIIGENHIDFLKEFDLGFVHLIIHTPIMNI